MRRSHASLSMKFGKSMAYLCRPAGSAQADGHGSERKFEAVRLLPGVSYRSAGFPQTSLSPHSLAVLLVGLMDSALPLRLGQAASGVTMSPLGFHLPT